MVRLMALIKRAVRLSMTMLFCIVFTVASVSAQNLVDPTRPLNRDQGALTKGGAPQHLDGFPVIKVSAIFVSPTQKYAIINGNTVFEGQEWANLMVKAISLNGVTLAKADVVKTFALQPITIKKDVSDEL